MKDYRRFWRLVKTKRAKNAFDGEGARRFGGRWNSRGTAMVYGSESRALAVLELLVHLPGFVPDGTFTFFEIRLELANIETIARESLPENWASPAIRLETQTLGDRWVRLQRQPAARVPSAIIPEECNVLLNPSHPAFSEISISAPIPFSLDRRLK